jgi:hypothetical protein
MTTEEWEDLYKPEPELLALVKRCKEAVSFFDPKIEGYPEPGCIESWEVLEKSGKKFCIVFDPHLIVIEEDGTEVSHTEIWVDGATVIDLMKRYEDFV